MKRYYQAYDARYRTVHEKGLQWSSDEPTPIVLEVLERYHVSPDAPMLEIGCGEGRDARAVLARGCNLLATDVSGEAVAHCRAAMPAFADRFQVTIGMTPLRYVTELRMRLASQWLTLERLPIEEVAQRLGYTSQAAFSRAFKRITGKTPGFSRKVR